MTLHLFSLLQINRLVALLLVVAGVLSGCAQVVVSHVSAFSDLGAERGTVRIQAGTNNDGESLEFAHYQDLLASQLTRHGYDVLGPTAAVEDVAELTAVLSFNVEEVRPDGSSYAAAYWEHRWYGLFRPASELVVLESRGDTRRQYKRRVAVHLTRNSGKKRVYEVAGDSIGRCEVMSVVFDEILEALFREFPRGNGSVQKIRVNGDARC